VDAHPHTNPTAHISTIILVRIASSFFTPGHSRVLTRTCHKGWDGEQREGWTLRATPGLTTTPLAPLPAGEGAKAKSTEHLTCIVTQY